MGIFSSACLFLSLAANIEAFGVFPFASRSGGKLSMTKETNTNEGLFFDGNDFSAEGLRQYLSQTTASTSSSISRSSSEFQHEKSQIENTGDNYLSKSYDNDVDPNNYYIDPMAFYFSQDDADTWGNQN